ncbi:hypothetical protein SIM91_02085 [Rhodococcus opacus]|uniref:hypothetical protein n=1 Tax=Rhodococcus TaxID=1827 RepID=UPI0024B64B98|nr:MULTISPECIES: hypothetical protein [Rhodococcus]MDI9941390.1 hypothetical protein [Rhodococcus sp. IEGM 1351]MDX5962133.1 hypothetical protein [Rhodococcus opacus]
MIDPTFIWTCAAITAAVELCRRFRLYRRALAHQRNAATRNWYNSEFALRKAYADRFLAALTAVVLFGIVLTAGTVFPGI